MRFSFWFELSGAAKLWVASGVFLIVGALIALALPPIVQPQEQDRDLALFLLRVLGGTLIGLGLAVFLPMLASLFIATERRVNWHWWINFIGGLFGALAFAIPATLMFPVFFLAYLTRPNGLFPANADATNNLGVAALFSAIGLAVLMLLFFLEHKMVREKRNPLEWTYRKET
jgi:hypothetical protein